MGVSWWCYSSSSPRDPGVTAPSLPFHSLHQGAAALVDADRDPPAYKWAGTRDRDSGPVPPVYKWASLGDPES